MLKNILIKCCELLCRDDLKHDLINHEKIENIPSSESQNDILRMISYYNFTANNIFENYINLNKSDYFQTDKNGIIPFENFILTPKKISSIKHNGSTVSYSLYSSHIKTNLPNTKLEIIYSYLPKQLHQLSENTNISNLTLQKIIVYGIVSEFFASKNQYNESEFWHAKFMEELFRMKIKKERHLKSTFSI